MGPQYETREQVDRQEIWLDTFGVEYDGRALPDVQAADAESDYDEDSSVADRL